MTYVHLRTGNQYEVVDYQFRYKQNGIWYDSVRYNRNGQGYARPVADFNQKFGKLGEVAKCKKGHIFLFNEQANERMGHTKCSFCDEKVTKNDLLKKEIKES